MIKQSFKTDQETFWAGEFGNQYINRNASAYLIASNIHLFSKILSNAETVRSVIEFGPNIGLNLLAIRSLIPDIELSGIEINSKAYNELKDIPGLKGYNTSILDFNTDYKRDLVLAKGILIHINPNELQSIYKKMYEASSKYVCIAEYYNPTPVEVLYRGHAGRLFKRDFAGEMLDLFKDLKLINYGFVYKRDTLFPQDDVTWFLLKKS